MFGVFLFTRFQASIIRSLGGFCWPSSTLLADPTPRRGLDRATITERRPYAQIDDAPCLLGVESELLRIFFVQEKAWKLESDRTGVGNSVMNWIPTMLAFVINKRCFLKGCLDLLIAHAIWITSHESILSTIRGSLCMRCRRIKVADVVWAWRLASCFQNL